MQSWNNIAKELPGYVPKEQLMLTIGELYKLEMVSGKDMHYSQPTMQKLNFKLGNMEFCLRHTQIALCHGRMGWCNIYLNDLTVE